MTFICTWTGSYSPKNVTLPDGTVEDVQYMRDGICLFASGNSASYTRIGEGIASFETIENRSDLNSALGNYLGRSR